MDVYIDDRVHQVLKEFYQAAMLKHPALDEVVVQRKVERLYNKVDSLGRFASSLPLARVKTDWIARGYREYIVEDFHFAYQIYKKEDGECIVRVHDACHSLLYHA